ncbi:hypothetical protein KSX_53130 [Ktedonospora formicarum]|uniref:Uncharacterized protein n=1 Tax=Ktedonospora formicarum TaxID=2778364 RepID=A0A8J3MW40_9CHLR|nr:hypothetical protein KSX_53130 [Ktedonospora formicarum]
MPPLFEPALAKEVLEGGIQVTQSLLEGALADLAHPRLRGLESIDLAMQIDGGGRFLPSFVGLLFAAKTVIEGPASGSSMFTAERLLPIIEVKFSPIPTDHPVALPPSVS